MSIIASTDVFSELQVVYTAIGLLLLSILVYILRADPEKALDFTVETPAACKADWKGAELERPTIKVSGFTAIQCYAPASGKSLGLINSSSPNGIDRVIARASAAQSKWKNSTFSQRRTVLKTLAKFILDNQETIIKAACLDSGKTRVDALFGEILVTAEKLQWTIKHGESALVPDQRPTNLLLFYKHNEVRYEPLGVVAACVSWK